MSDGYDRLENESGGGGSFVKGLLTGTVLGAGLGMLFAPKPGSELRNQITDQASSLANTATDSYRKVTEAASELADKSREMYDKARDAVTHGAEEAQRYVRDTASSVTGGRHAAPATSSGSSYGSSSYGSPSLSGGSSEGMRGGSGYGGSSEQMRGSGHSEPSR